MDVVLGLAVVLIVALGAAVVYLWLQLSSERKRKVSEEEIRDIVSDAEELGAEEKRMIRDIMDLDDTTVREIMIPRVDIIAVEDAETVHQTIERMRGTGHSRLPVYHEDADEIVGVVHYKDLIDPLLEGKADDPVGDYAYEPLFVPETKDVYPLLAEMQTKHQQMAIVVDEYGGTDGLITVEDIVEEIVGEIEDETDHGGALVREREEGVWVADGRLPIEDALELGWPVEDSDDYETLAGWVLDMLDTVPKVGDEFEQGGYRFKVQFMRRRRINSIKVTRIETTEKNSPTES